MDDPLAELGPLLDSLGIAYALIGGHAVNVWLEPRFTADVDLTVEVDSEDLERLEQALQVAGFALEVSLGASPSGPDFVRFRSTDGRVVLELQAAKTSFQFEVIRRATHANKGLRVATPEDLIVLKLIANRPKDQIDLFGLAALPSIDWDHVERWAREWNLTEELRRLRSR